MILLWILLIIGVTLASQSPTQYPSISPSTSIITTFAGTGATGFSGATISNGPAGIDFDASGNLYINEYGGHRTLKITIATGIITVFAGTGTPGYSGDGGAATSATLNYPNGLCLDTSGNVYIADWAFHFIRKVTAATSIISTIAGTGSGTYNGDNIAATSASLNRPIGVAVDTSGNVYIGDGYNNRVRKVTASTCVITTIAEVPVPHGINLDSDSNVYVISSTALWKITASTGELTLLAGSTSSSGYNGDNIQATAAMFSTPHDVVVDTNGNLYIADAYNYRIRKVDVSTGLISTVVGTGTQSSTGDGYAATSATIGYSPFIRFDSSDNLYISDNGDNRIRKVTNLAATPTPTYYPTLSPSTSIMSTFAGTGSGGYSGDGGQASSTTISCPIGIDHDSSGNIYFSDCIDNRVFKVTASTGIITTYAGTGTGGFSGDNGLASSATLNYPYGLCIDTSDNVYISDLNNNRIRKVTATTSVIFTIVGTDSSTFGDNVVGTSAGIFYPAGVAVDGSGNIYISDMNNNRIRKFTVATGVVTTIAGIGTAGYSGDGGPATAAIIAKPHGINLDDSRNVYFGDQYAYNVIRKITVSTGVISTVAGTGDLTGGYNGDNIQATAATLNSPHDVVLDSNGNLYISDRYNRRIRKVDVSTGLITTVVGTGVPASTGDGSESTSATISGTCQIRFDSGGNLYISECNGARIRKATNIASPQPTQYPTLSPSSASVIATTPTYGPTISPNSASIIITIAGTGASSFSGDNGPAIAAELNRPRGIDVDATGNVYIAVNDRIRKVTISTGIITTIAGCDTYEPYSGDNGPATSAGMNIPVDVALDSAGISYMNLIVTFDLPPYLGNVYIAEYFNHCIRKVTISTGIITTIAGTGAMGYSNDGGPAAGAMLRYPQGVAVDSADNVYIADTYTQRIRKVTVSTGIITTVAGTGTLGSSGDNGPATSAALNNPSDIALDSAGNMYIVVDSCVRKVTTSTGIITTIAGTGTSYGDNGPATSSTLSATGVALDSVGNIYIADEYDQRIRKVTVSTGIITTIAGAGTQGYSGDNGFATIAALNSPERVAVDGSGNVYVADKYNHRIRKVTVVELTSEPTSSPTLTPTSSPTSIPTYDEDSASIVQLYLSIQGWPSELVDSTQEGIFKSLIVQSAAVRAPFVSLSYTFTALSSNKRILLFRSLLVNSLWQLTITASVTTTSPQSIKTAFSSYMATSFNITALIGQLNTACNCATYSAIQVDYGVYEPPPPHKYATISEYITPQYTALVVAIPVVLFCVTLIVTITMNSISTQSMTAASFVGVSILAACIVFADHYYLLFAKYYSYQLLLVSAIFVLLPSIQFMTMLHDIHAFPYPLIEYYPGKIASDKYNINVFWFWLSHGEWSPLINREQQPFTFAHHDSVPKVLVFIVTWLVVIVLQLLSLLPYALFLGVVMLPYYATMLLVGCFFFQTKLLIYTPVWNTYMYLFTGKTNVFDKRGIDFDTSLLNESFFVQLLLLAVPQVIIKGINNTLVANDSAITPVYSLSLSVSVIAVAIWLYRYMLTDDSVETFGLAKGTYDVRNNHELQELHKASLLYIVPSYELEYASRNYNYITDKCLILDAEAIQGFKMELFNSLRQFNTHPLSSMRTSITDRIFQLLIHDSVDLSMYRYLRSVSITSPVDLLNGCSIDVIRGILYRINDKKVRKLVENYLRLLAHNTADKGVRDSIVSFISYVLDALTGNNNVSDNMPRMVVFDIESSKYNQIELIEVSPDFINVTPSDITNQEVPQVTR